MHSFDIYLFVIFNYCKILANYKFPIAWPERYMVETRTLEQVLEEEENWEYYK